MIAVAQPNVDDFTVPEKILLAADLLEQQGQTPFSAEVLTVAVWKKFPNTFGLKGFAEEHPDNNKVLSSLMGEKGLARRGWLVKTGQKMYALTKEGRKVIRRVMLQEGDEPEAPNLQKLPRELERFVVAMFDSSAYQKFEENRKTDLTFADACRFWGITENMAADVLDTRLERVRIELTGIEVRLGPNGAVLSDGRSVSAEDVGSLLDTHEFLQGRFSRHLNLLRSRGGKA